MNNNDFQRLLVTNDKALVTELTKPRKAGGGGADKKRERAKGKGKGKDEGKGKGKGKASAGATPSGGQAPEGPQYRDRAKERREQKGEYEDIAQEFESHGEVSIDQSKYLGGDLQHTHLVKGLDFALLSKVRTEITKQQKVEEIKDQRAQRKAGKASAQQKKSFETQLGRRVYFSVVETLHPHHLSFKKRMSNMTKALSVGQRIRGAPSAFLPGRMAYEFDTGMSQGSSDIPRTVFASKEDAPKVDLSKRVAPILTATVTTVKDTLQKIIDDRKQRKKDKAAGISKDSTYAVVQKVVPKVKAKDAEDDIFGGIEKFDPTEAARKAKGVVEAQRKEAAKKDTSSSSSSKAVSSSEGKKSSYFADAGAEKYLRAPEGQLEMEDIQVEDDGTEGAARRAKPKLVDDSKLEFDPCPKWIGPRRGWVFKTGSQGLGYYREATAQAAAAAAEEAKTATAGQKRKRTAAKAAAAAEGGEAGDDAYGECFPGASMGYAAVDTGEGDSDEEGDDVKKKIERLKKLAGKSGDADSMSANRKEGGEAKKKKLNEAQQWQKIDHMIKKGKHSSMEELEARGVNKKQPPKPREIMSTPAF